MYNAQYRLARVPVHADFLCLVMQFVDQNVVNTKAYVGCFFLSLFAPLFDRAVCLARSGMFFDLPITKYLQHFCAATNDSKPTKNKKINKAIWLNFSF